MGDSSIHVHAPRVTRKSRHAGVCLDCEKRTRFLSFFTPWYGWDSTCLRCGRRWSDGEWMRLAFEPQSRQKSIDAAKRRWRRIKPTPARDSRALNEDK